MQPTKKDRLYLLNPTMILKVLDGKSENHCSAFMSEVGNRFDIYYSFVHDQNYQEISLAKGRFVYDVLSLYRSVESYKKDISADDIEHFAWSFFPGFDGNYESEYRGFALFLIESQKKFPEQIAYKHKTDMFNSHAQTLDKYHRMVFEWRRLGKDLTTRGNIMRVLDA
jgi:uncharacterized protein YfbU (UPF0304 family)